MADSGPLVVDTSVYSAFLARKGSSNPIVKLYEPHLRGRTLILSFQTVAELRFGAQKAGWGAHRLAQLESRIRAAVVVPADDALTKAFASLKVTCSSTGHPLAQRYHTADLWIATTAIHSGYPLVAHDSVFKGAPGLTLVTELP